GTCKGLWQTEVGGYLQSGPQPGPIAPTYLQFLYWALEPTANGGFGWNSTNPDKFKMFYYAGYQNETETRTLTTGPQYAPTLTTNGTIHAFLNTVFGGQTLSALNNFSAQPALLTSPYTQSTGTVAFSVGAKEVALGFIAVSGSISAAIPLASAPTSTILYDT